MDWGLVRKAGTSPVTLGIRVVCLVPWILWITMRLDLYIIESINYMYIRASQ